MTEKTGKKKGRPTSTDQIKELRTQLADQSAELGALAGLIKDLAGNVKDLAKVKAKPALEIEYIEPKKGQAPDIVKIFQQAREIENGLWQERVDFLENRLEVAKEAAAAVPETVEAVPAGWLKIAGPLINKLIDKGVGLAEMKIALDSGGTLADAAEEAATDA